MLDQKPRCRVNYGRRVFTQVHVDRGIPLADSRYQKQMLFHGIGPEGQQRISNSRVLLVGCGALGCVLADSMVRAGVGHVRIVDRDFVELTNLQRQSLYDEQDVAEHIPKAIAAERRLRRVNSQIEIQAIVADVDFSNLDELARGTSLILDGTDNFEIRYLINDVSLETGIPWIFTGCTGSSGQVMPVFPGQSPCLRCLMPFPPPPGTTETCDTAGVLGPAIGMLASFQAAIALKILAGHRDQVEQRLTIIDAWNGAFRHVDVSHLRNSTACPACHNRERLWRNGNQRAASTVLCGRNSVQITPPEKVTFQLPELAERLKKSGIVIQNRFLVRLTLPELERTSENPESALEITIFPDGRAIIRGTSDPGIARSLYSRYIGS